MDLLSQHEAFLRAIFDNPEDNTARLVYADFLQETGEEDKAEFIRVQWERSQPRDVEPARWRELAARVTELSESVVPWGEMRTTNGSALFNRGLWREGITPGVVVSADDLANPMKFREWVVRVNPAWFGETKLSVRFGSRLLSQHIHSLYRLAFVQQVTQWDLSGHLEEYSLPPDLDGFVPMENHGPELGDLVVQPVLTQSGLDGLVRHRAAKRITCLDLRNNRLGSDAARLLVKSPYLDNIKQLRLLEGNYLRGKVWQEVIERFGEDVVE